MYTLSGFAVVAYAPQAALSSAEDQVCTVEWRKAITQGSFNLPTPVGPLQFAGGFGLEEAVALFSGILAGMVPVRGRRLWTSKKVLTHVPKSALRPRPSSNRRAVRLGQKPSSDQRQPAAGQGSRQVCEVLCAVASSGSSLRSCPISARNS